MGLILAQGSLYSCLCDRIHGANGELQLGAPARHASACVPTTSGKPVSKGQGPAGDPKRSPFPPAVARLWKVCKECLAPSAGWPSLLALENGLLDPQDHILMGRGVGHKRTPPDQQEQPLYPLTSPTSVVYTDKCCPKSPRAVPFTLPEPPEH